MTAPTEMLGQDSLTGEAIQEIAEAYHGDDWGIKNTRVHAFALAIEQAARAPLLVKLAAAEEARREAQAELERYKAEVCRLQPLAEQRDYCMTSIAELEEKILQRNGEANQESQTALETTIKQMVRAELIGVIWAEERDTYMDRIAELERKVVAQYYEGYAQGRSEGYAHGHVVGTRYGSAPVRSSALEEAAKVCEKEWTTYEEKQAGRYFAAAIRLQINKPTGDTAEMVALVHDDPADAA